MTDEMVGTDALASDSSVATPGTEAAPASSPDPNDFDARLRGDPEFAVAEFKKQQAAASRANDRLRKADLAIQVAERIGGGDLTKGSEVALQELMLLRSMRDNPEMAKYIDRFQNGSPLAPQPSVDSGGYLQGGGLEEPEDPREVQLRALQGNVARLEENLSVRSAVDAFQGFRNTEYGQLLSKEELAEAFGAVEASAKAWATTPDGRKRLMALSSDDVRTIVLSQLDRAGKLLELGERRAQQRRTQLQERETDSPTRTQANGVTHAAAGDSWQAAWDAAAAQIGVNRS